MYIKANYPRPADLYIMNSMWFIFITMTTVNPQLQTLTPNP